MLTGTKRTKARALPEGTLPVYGKGVVHSHIYKGKEYHMQVKGTNTALLNRAATAIENSYSDSQEKQEAIRVNAGALEENAENEEQSVMLSISAAGRKRSELLASQPENEGEKNEFSSEAELEGMLKKMEGLSSQIINGYFSISDRLNFNNEIQRLNTELNRLNGDAVSATKDDCAQLSKRISDLTKIISDAAVYRQSARNVFMVNSKQPAKAVRTQLDIAI